MSRLFDALQRSESERSGVALSELPTATEILKRAENHVVSALERDVEVSPSGPAESPERDTLAASEASVSDEPSLNGKPSDKFAQFPSTVVSLTSDSRLVCLTDGESLASEEFRFLGVRLQHLRRDRPLKKLLITSTIPQEGKSTVAANLACTLARKAQQKTLLLEGDVRRPSLSQTFGLGTIPGLCEYLQGERSLTESVYYLEGPGFWLLPAGIDSKNPLELLQSGSLSMLVDQLAAWFDWLIIDSPPVLPLADTSIWARVADGILLVTRQGITEKRQLEKGLEAIEPKKLIGALLNCFKSPLPSEYYYSSHPTTSRTNGSSAE